MAYRVNRETPKHHQQRQHDRVSAESVEEGVDERIGRVYEVFLT